MIDAILILVLFLILGVLAYFESSIPVALKWVTYIAVGLGLVALATFRTAGADPDYEAYEQYFSGRAYRLDEEVEYSYIIICNLIGFLTSNVQVLFFLYAALGVSLKLGSLPKYGDDLILFLTGYLCYYFPLHEMMQIRSGVLAGFMLLAIPYIAEQKRLKAFVLLAMGTFFHYSGLALLPILFLSNRFTLRTRCFWGIFIPACYVIGKISNDLSLFYQVPYIGAKLATYSSVSFSNGIFLSDANVFSPFQLLTIVVFYYLFFFAVNCPQAKYLPLLLKIFAIGIGSYVVLQAFPTICERISMMFNVVMVVLIPYIAYTIKPKWLGITAVLLLEFIYINYILRYVYNFTIFLSPNT